MAFRDLNDAGGPHGCKLVADTRNSQSQGAVAVDAANQLVQLKKVPVIIGGIISSVSIPILTSVTGPAKIVQVSPASSSPTLTKLGREGKTNGMFFRTITSDALQGTAAAKYALDQGFKKIAVIHVNNDFGVNMFTEFSKAYKALGGEIVSVSPYNEKQSSYDAEASQRHRRQARRALSDRHAGRRRDDRPRLDQPGRPGEIPAQRRHEQPGFHCKRRREISQRRLRHVVGDEPDGLDRIFQRQLQGVLGGIDPSNPAADRAYDAGAIVGLAVAAAPTQDRPPTFATRSTKSPPRTASRSTPARPSSRKALDLLKGGKTIRYEGVIGPIAFDEYGDITGPFRLWKIIDGKVTTIGEMSTDDVNAIKAKLGKIGLAVSKCPRYPRPALGARARSRNQPPRHRSLAGGRHGARRPRTRSRGGVLRAARLCPRGFDTFDMADHYGSAELIAGRSARARRRAAALGPSPSPNGVHRQGR